MPLACIYSTSFCLQKLKAWRLIPLPPNSAPPDHSIVSVDGVDKGDSVDAIDVLDTSDTLDTAADNADILDTVADTPDYDSVNLTLYAASASRSSSKEDRTSRESSPVLSYKVMRCCFSASSIIFINNNNTWKLFSSAPGRRPRGPPRRGPGRPGRGGGGGWRPRPRPATPTPPSTTASTACPDRPASCASSRKPSRFSTVILLFSSTNDGNKMKDLDMEKLLGIRDVYMKTIMDSNYKKHEIFYTREQV